MKQRSRYVEIAGCNAFHDATQQHLSLDPPSLLNARVFQTPQPMKLVMQDFCNKYILSESDDMIMTSPRVSPLDKAPPEPLKTLNRVFTGSVVLPMPHDE